MIKINDSLYVNPKDIVAVEIITYIHAGYPVYDEQTNTAYKYPAHNVKYHMKFNIVMNGKLYDNYLGAKNELEYFLKEKENQEAIHNKVAANSTGNPFGSGFHPDHNTEPEPEK